MFSSEIVGSSEMSKGISNSEMDFYQQSSGLPRYRSAPRSFLAALLDSPADKSSSGDESDSFFSAIWNGPREINEKGSDDSCQNQFQKLESGSESEIRPEFSNGLTNYDSPLPGNGGGGSPIVGSVMESHVQKRLNSDGSNLVRQNSSPAGFFNGLGVVGNYGANRANSSTTDASISHLNFSAGPSMSPRTMLDIPDNRHIENEHFRNGKNGEFEPPWSESLKRNHDGDLKMFSTYSDERNVRIQATETRKNAMKLVHHLSLPTTSNEKGEAEKFRFLQFQPDVVPCQIRAKRGCATHPRSIAERIRRTRISDKMKKLQELFPNMDKQTSTADMLDLAAEYIKDLHNQVQMLTDAKSNCVCSSSKGN